MERFSVSYPDFQDWTGREDLFESASMFTYLERDLAGEGDPERLIMAGVHRRFFETLGSRAAAGRLLVSEDQDPGAERTVVLGEGLWRRRFGADPAVVGQTVRLDAVPHTVVGVVAEGEGWPRGAEAWVPLQYGATPPDFVQRRSNHAWQVIGRLQPEVTARQASEQVGAMARAWYTANGAGGEQTVAATVIRFRSLITGGGAAPALIVVGAAVLLVLLIACINQANILLVNAWTRAREISLRAALGAGRGRLVSLLMGESLVLALAGAGLGLGLAVIGIRAIETMVPEGGAGDLDPQLNGPVLAAALGLALLTSVVAGLIPAFRASRTSMSAALTEGGAGAGSGRSAARLRRTLVVVEMTLSVVLLSGAGLTIRTFQSQLGSAAGLYPEGILVFDLRLPQARYPDRDATSQFFDEAILRLEASPGVQSASVGSALPLGVSRSNLYRVFLMEGAEEPPAGPEFGARWIEVDPGYFEALGMTPVRGRGITADDGPESAPVLLVNEAMARQMSPGEEVIGLRIRSWRDENLLRDVVGVVPDFQLGGMAGRTEPAVFVPRKQGEFRNLSFLVRASGDPTSLVPGIREAMGELDPNLALEGLRTLQDAHRDELAVVRIVTVLFTVFGALALVLAISGVYGLVALSVAQRTREIGIRMALGDSTGSVLRRILGEGVRLALLGALVGLGLSMTLAAVLSSRIVGVPALDPVAVLLIAGLLGVAALAASTIPALKATRVDPVRALRAE
jgi:predicted permease